MKHKTPTTGRGKPGRTFSVPTTDGKPVAAPNSAVGRRPVFRAGKGPAVKEVRTVGNPGDIPGNSGETPGKFGPRISKPLKSQKPHEMPGSDERVTRSHGSHDTRTYQKHKCGAKARSTGKPCRRWANIGRTRCRLHGGNSPKGPDSPHWTGGFFSSALPADLAKLARQAANDTTLRDMKEAIAVGDVRIRELLGTLDSGGAGSWDGAAKSMKALESAGDDLNAARKALDELRATITAGRTKQAAWDEINELFQKRDRLLTGEVTRHKATADTINADRVAAFMVGMMDALREESNGDRELLRRVFHRWERLMGMAGVTAPATT